MTLRKKTLLIISATLLGLMGLLYASSRTIVLGSFVTLENDTVERDVRRSQSALDREQDTLIAAASQLAYSSDPASIDTRLSIPVFAANRLNMLALVDATGNAIYATGFDLQAQAKIPFPSEELGPVLRSVVESGNSSGIVMLPRGPLMVAVLPIQPTSGLAQGMILVGRFLDHAEILRIADEFDLLLNLYSLNDPDLPGDYRRASKDLSRLDDITIHPLSVRSVAGYRLISDLNGKPALILRVELPRTVYEQGQTSIWYFLLATIGAGLVFGIMMLILLEQAVLSRLSRLSASVEDVGLSSNLSSRVLDAGDDELSRLGKAVNRMLEALERSQNTLLGSEQRLRTVISNAPVILYALDSQGRFNFLEGRGLGGISPRDYMGRPLAELFGKSPPHTQVTHSTSDGALVVVTEANGLLFEMRQIPLMAPNGMITGTIGIATDITERSRAEAAEHEQHVMAEALRETAAALTSTLNLNEVLDRILSSVGRVMPHEAANIMLLEGDEAAVVRSRGYSERGLDLWINSLRFVASDVPVFRRMIQTAQSVVLPDTRLSTGWLAYPETGWVRSSISAPICLDGQVIGVLNLDSASSGFFSQEHMERLHVFADQAAVAIRNAQLFEAERYERLLAQTLQKTAETLAASSKLEDKLKVIAEQLEHVIHCDRAVILLEEGDGLDIFAENAQIFEAVQAGQPIILHEQEINGANLPGCDENTRAWIGMPLVAHDSIIGFLSVANSRAYTRREIDVIGAFAQQATLAVENARILSELETSLANLREAQSHLVRTARLSAAGEIAAGVAHQINNPLTTVIAESHLMLQDLDSGDPNRESLEAVLEAAQRAGTVVRRMLDLTRTHAYAMQPVDINYSLQSSLALIRAQIVPHVAQLDVNLAEPLPLVIASEQHLEDVWINLLINARDALRSRKDGVIRVTSRLSEDGDTVRVAVEDNGAGMSAEQASRIFEPFFTTKEYGTGLGLSICQDVITHHGGSISVESVEGQGTTFVVILPIESEGAV